jgi:hypothetical protein
MKQSSEVEPAMESDYTPENRRAFSRADIYVPLEFRLVPEEEREFVKSRISEEPFLVDFHRAPLPENHPQAEWINLLDAKLERIIRMLSLQSTNSHSLPFKYVTISGSGMSFSSQQIYNLGDLLEIRIMLTWNRPAAFYLYGKVVKTRRQTSGYFISVSFQMIDEAIRERIIRFVFEVEREMLRERRNAPC